MRVKKTFLPIFMVVVMLFSSIAVYPAAIVLAADEPPAGTAPGGTPPDGAPPGGGPGGEGGAAAVTKVSVTEGNWSFDLVTTTSGTEVTKTSTITYYAGKTDEVVIIPSVLGGVPVTTISAQAFGHHSEIMAVYVPDSVTEVADWAFYDLNTAVIISFANPEVSIDEAAFQSSGNAVLYLPASTTLTSGGGKNVVTANTALLSVALENTAAAAIAGGTYLNVTSSGSYAITAAAVAGIAVSASGETADVSYAENTVTFTGDDYVAAEQKVEIHEDFATEISADELTKTFRSLTAEGAVTLNEAIAADSSYSKIKSLLQFEEGYYINGNKVELDANSVAYDIQTGEKVSAEEATGMLPSTGYGNYKYITYRDTDNDGDVDAIYYSPYNVNYSYNTVTISSDNKNLNGLSARDILSTVYLSYANSVIKVSGEGDEFYQKELTADTSVDGDAIDAAINQERSVLWADNYGTIDIDELHAVSSSVGNWGKMSYESGLSAYNVEIIMEWGMNALLYATNGGEIRVGDLLGETSTFYANGDGANGIIAGGAGTEAGNEEASIATSSAYVYNSDFILEGWNNHVADMVYGGYAYLNRVTSVTGIAGSYAVGQSSALANDFGNGVIDASNFHTTVYGNRSAGAYVIGGGVITAEDSSFVSKMDAGLVSASGGTFNIFDSTATGQIGFRNRGGINADSTSTLNNVTLTAEKDSTGYVIGEQAAQAAAAWETASGGAELMHYMMSDPDMTLGQLCENYDVSAEAAAALIAELSSIAGTTYTADTLIRNSVLDNTYYNYSAGAYTGTTDYSGIPYLTIGSAYGGLSSAVMGFEASGIQLILNNSSFSNNNGADYNYLVSSEAGSAPVIQFNSSDASGIIWNEGDVTRMVEGQSGDRSSKLTVSFTDSAFAGSFADGSNGLWSVSGLSYTDGTGSPSSLNGNYYGAAANWGSSASFDATSSWTLTHDSYLGHLSIAEGATIHAPDGYAVKMTVDGVETDVAAGDYTGEIVLSLAVIQ